MQIAKTALSLIGPMESVVIDAGTTTMALANCITSRGDITVLTNSIPIALLLNNTSVRTFLCGGFVIDTALMDDDAVAFFASRKVNKAFIGATGIHEEGVTTVSPFQRAVKQQMIKSANEVYVLADSSKFNIVGVNVVARFSDLTGIITDAPITNPRILEQLKKNNVRVIVADK
jgi:DeoR family transcriptional regulator, fructose operon transcriptional repressor